MDLPEIHSISYLDSMRQSRVDRSRAWPRFFAVEEGL
jgi:hypothetical protein